MDLEKSKKYILQKLLAESSSQNSTVSGLFPIQQRTIGARPQVAHLVHMKCNKVVLNKAILKKVHTKSNCCGKATVNMPQPKLPRFVESGVDIYTVTGNLIKFNTMNSNINLCKKCTLVFMRPIRSSIPNMIPVVYLQRILFWMTKMVSTQEGLMHPLYSLGATL